MMKKRFVLIILACILLASLVVRIYKLGSLPQILNRDEAGLAYNAFLLKETGKDEWERSWPLSLESFGDYKLPGYPVVLVLFFSILGESDVVVRLPAALAGVSLVALGYMLAKQSKWGNRSALMLAVILATTPVFFFYSRIAFEALVGLAFFVLSLLLLFKKADNQQKRLFFDVTAVLLWTIAALTYNTPLLYVPFYIPVIIFARGLFRIRSWAVPVVGLLFLFTSLFIAQINLTSQKSGITIFSDETSREHANMWYASFNGPSRTLLGNKYVYFGTQVAKNAVKTFSPSFLLSKGGSHPLHQMPGTGHITVTVYLFGILGLFMASHKILKRLSRSMNLQKIIKREGTELLLVYSTIISLAPALVTVDAPHATRSLFFFFCLAVVAVYGVRQLKGNIAALFVIVSILLFAEYVSMYFNEYPQKQPSLLGVGYDTVIQEVDMSTQEQVAVVDPDGYQYILTAWYLKTDPQVFFDSIIKQLPNSYGFKYGQQMDRYHFIGHASDRSSSEKTLVEWKDGSWQVERF